MIDKPSNDVGCLVDPCLALLNRKTGRFSFDRYGESVAEARKSGSVAG